MISVNEFPLSPSNKKAETPKEEKKPNYPSQFDRLVNKVAMVTILVLGAGIGVGIVSLVAGSVAVLPLVVSAVGGLILSGAIVLLVNAVFKKVMQNKIEQKKPPAAPLRASPLPNPNKINNIESNTQEKSNNLDSNNPETKNLEIINPTDYSSDDQIHFSILPQDDDDDLEVLFIDEKPQNAEPMSESPPKSQTALVPDENLDIDNALLDSYVWITSEDSQESNLEESNLEDSFLLMPFYPPQDPTFGGDIFERTKFYLERCNSFLKESDIPNAIVMKEDLVGMFTDRALSEVIELEPALKIENYPPVSLIASQFFKDLVRCTTISVNGESLFDAKVRGNSSDEDLKRLVLSGMIEKLGPGLVGKISHWMHQTLQSHTLLFIHRLIAQDESLGICNVPGQMHYKITTNENEIVIEAGCVYLVGDQYPCMSGVFGNKYTSVVPVGYTYVHKRITCSQEELINHRPGQDLPSLLVEQTISPFYASISEAKSFVNA